ncbi:MAG: SH3 domain-containing protein [Pyrinomonadaceae bacterium]
MKIRVLALILLTAAAAGLTACSIIGGGVLGPSDTATVIAKTAQIRTSYAVVAADLLEVKRGDRLDVIDSFEYEKVLWYRVRAYDDVSTEGWIEAQNVITSETLAKSKELAEEFKDQPPQAAGMIRSASNLRSAPDMSPENILFKLANGSNFEIMAWRFVPKQEVADVDDAQPGESVKGKPTKNAEIEAAKEEGEPERIDEKYDIWYQVRLDPSVSPAPAGWIFGRQVELQVPSDIVFFQQNNRKFVTWQRLDADSANKVGVGDSSLAPGSWVVLARNNFSKPIDGVEPDFDYILVLAFDKYDQSYYTVWRTSNNTEVWGQLPLTVDGKGDNKTFTVKLRNSSGAIDEKRFIVFRDKNRLKVTPPEDIAQYETKSK